jgi:hypothetical protein
MCHSLTFGNNSNISKLIHEETKSRLNSGNTSTCYYSVLNLSSHLLSKNTEDQNTQNCFTCCFVHVRKFVSHINGTTQSEGFQIRVLRRMVRHKREKEMGGWIKTV